MGNLQKKAADPVSSDIEKSIFTKAFDLFDDRRKSNALRLRRYASRQMAKKFRKSLIPRDIYEQVNFRQKFQKEVNRVDTLVNEKIIDLIKGQVRPSEAKNEIIKLLNDQFLTQKILDELKDIDNTQNAGKAETIKVADILRSLNLTSIDDRYYEVGKLFAQVKKSKAKSKNKLSKVIDSAETTLSEWKSKIGEIKKIVGSSQSDLKEKEKGSVTDQNLDNWVSVFCSFLLGQINKQLARESDYFYLDKKDIAAINNPVLVENFIKNMRSSIKEIDSQYEEEVLQFDFVFTLVQAKTKFLKAKQTIDLIVSFEEFKMVKSNENYRSNFKIKSILKCQQEPIAPFAFNDSNTNTLSLATELVSKSVIPAITELENRKVFG